MGGQLSGGESCKCHYSLVVYLMLLGSTRPIWGKVKMMKMLFLIILFLIVVLPVTIVNAKHITIAWVVQNYGAEK